MKPYSPVKFRGFTLIELMIVLVVMGILTSVAIPSYRNYMLRAHRVDAKTALLRLAANQEKFFLQNNSYATSSVLGDAPPDGLGMESTTENGYFTLVLTTAANGQSYVAEANATGGQTDDVDCDVYGINSAGLEYGGPGPNFDTGSNNPDCW